MCVRIGDEGCVWDEVDMCGGMCVGCGLCGMCCVCDEGDTYVCGMCCVWDDGDTYVCVLNMLCVG